MRFYIIGVNIAAVMIFLKGFDEEYVDRVRKLYKKFPFEDSFAVAMLLAYLFLGIFSWVTVVGTLIKYSKEWIN